MISPAIILDARSIVVGHEVHDRRATQPFTPEIRQTSISQGSLGRSHVAMVEGVSRVGSYARRQRIGSRPTTDDDEIGV
jgi:hypothetical protein